MCAEDPVHDVPTPVRTLLRILGGDHIDTPSTQTPKRLEDAIIEVTPAKQPQLDPIVQRVGLGPPSNTEYLPGTEEVMPAESLLEPVEPMDVQLAVDRVIGGADGYGVTVSAKTPKRPRNIPSELHTAVQDDCAAGRPTI
jgi:hypothetical protein